MSVSEEASFNNVLVSLHKSLVSSSKLQRKVEGLYMTNDVGVTICCFDCNKLFFQPLQMISRVILVTRKIEITLVWNLGVHNDHLTSILSLASFHSEWNTTITVLYEFSCSILTKPLCPIINKVIDREVYARGTKVLVVYWPSVVVSSRWVDRNISPFESLLYFLCYNLCIVSHLFITIVPCVVRTIISSPENWGNIVCLNYVLQHILESYDWDVTQIATPFTSSFFWVFRVTKLLSATKVAITVPKSSFLVLGVKMNITQV